MTDKDNLDEKLNTLGQAIGSDDKLLENVMSRINAKPNFGPTEAKAQNIWRIIMKSPLTKLAAAAVIVFAVIVGLSDLQFTNPVYGITDVAEILKKSGTVHFKGWQCASVQPGLYDPNIIQPGQKETRALFEYWIDMETGAMRCTRPSSVKVKGNEFRTSVYTEIYDGEYMMSINDEIRRVSFTKFSPYQQLIRKKKNIASILMNLLPLLDSSDMYKKIDEEKNGDHVFDIWQAEYSPPSIKDYKFRLKAWISSANRHLGRIEFWTKMPGMSWFQHAEFNQIEYNVSILNDVFATKIPEGYSSTNTKQSAFLNELFQNSNYIWYDQNDKKTSQKITSYACFTLNDGSVILGWSCTTGTTIGSTETDPESDIYQKEIFRELLVGSPLPKLPFVYYTVSPINEEPGIKYQGRHITYTLKNNVFHEWSIYVPDNKLDKYYGQLNYNLHYKSNREDVIKNGATTLGEIGDIRIENKNDFDTFVLGAMAELSEDGKAPEGVTYESVLQLTKQIRESMTQ